MRPGMGGPALRRELAEEGYCVVPDFVVRDQIEALRRFTRGAAPPPRENGVGDPAHRIGHAETLCPSRGEIQRSERTLSVLRGTYGHDIALHHAKFVLEGPGGGEVPRHQGFAYRARDSEHPCQLNCMVYIDDADEDNGCLRVVFTNPLLDVHREVLDRFFPVERVGRGPRARSRVRSCAWTPTGSGIGIRLGS